MELNLFSTLTVVLIWLSCAAHLQATTYTVGDGDKWDLGVNFLTWSEKYKFFVDDILLFSYRKGQHDVYEVSEAEYKSCNVSSNQTKFYNSGEDNVVLTTARKYWFLCDVDFHCRGGMKFGIDVRSNGNGTGEVAASPTPAVNGVRGERWWLWRRWLWFVVGCCWLLGWV